MSVTRSSESAVQHREGPDLDLLVEQIAAEHPAPVRFLDIDRVRRGGVMGFFAKEQYALSYQVAEDLELDDDTISPPTAGRHAAGAIEPVDLEALLGSADSRDIGPSLPTPALHAVLTEPAGPADERFADLLLRLAAEHAPEPPTASPTVLRTPGRHQAESVTFEPLHSAPQSRHRLPDETPVPATPVIEPSPETVVVPHVSTVVESTADSEICAASGDAPPARVDATPVDADTVSPRAEVAPSTVALSTVAPSTIPRPPVAPASAACTPAGLTALGVPTGWAAPAADATRAAEIVAAVLALPPAPVAPTAAGAVIVLLSDSAGSPDHALRHLTALAPGGSYTATDRDSAVRAVAELRGGDAAGVLVVRPDRAAALPSTIAALQPDLTVLEVEATGKTSDHRRRLDAAVTAGLRVDALAVVRATETTSPATVWELGIPILSVDGRTSDIGTWVGLLLASDR